MTGSGGVWHFKNRQVPDVYSTTIEYDRFGCTILGSCAAGHPNQRHPPTIYGRKGSIEHRSGSVLVSPEREHLEEFRRRTGQDQLIHEVDNRNELTAREAHMLNFWSA